MERMIRQPCKSVAPLYAELHVACAAAGQGGGRQSGRGDGRRGRGGQARGAGGRGAGVSAGRAPASSGPPGFNPYASPDLGAIKGGKRSGTAPRSGNRNMTFGSGS